MTDWGNHDKGGWQIKLAGCCLVAGPTPRGPLTVSNSQSACLSGPFLVLPPLQPKQTGRPNNTRPQSEPRRSSDGHCPRNCKSQLPWPSFEVYSFSCIRAQPQVSCLVVREIGRERKERQRRKTKKKHKDRHAEGLFRIRPLADTTHRHHVTNHSLTGH